MKTSALMTTTAPAAARPPLDSGVGIAAAGLTVEHRKGITALADVTLTIEPRMLTSVPTIPSRSRSERMFRG